MSPRSPRPDPDRPDRVRQDRACADLAAPGAEIVAMDSMTLYRGMDIGTAKPTPAESARSRTT